MLSRASKCIAFVFICSTLAHCHSNCVLAQDAPSTGTPDAADTVVSLLKQDVALERHISGAKVDTIWKQSFESSDIAEGTVIVLQLVERRPKYADYYPSAVVVVNSEGKIIRWIKGPHVKVVRVAISVSSSKTVSLAIYADRLVRGVGRASYPVFGEIGTGWNYTNNVLK